MTNELTTCPECGAELKIRANQWIVDEERYKIVREHYCPACGWTDGEEED